MNLNKLTNGILSVAARTVESGARIIDSLPPSAACSTVRTKTRAAAVLAVSLLGIQPARAQEKDASVENGSDVLLTGHLEPMDFNNGETSTEPCDIEPAEDGRRKINGTCVFFSSGPDGINFKMELQDAEALMDTDLNVELKTGGIRNIEGIKVPPKITVCGTHHCMTADIENVGWVLRTADNEVQVKSELGDVLVTTTFDTETRLHDGEWANVVLENPENANMPANCAIRWTGEKGHGSDAMLAAMAALLYLELMKKRRKNGQKRG